ncbi:MAG: hypothetical protein DMD87_20630 [Candidatus Rokuibacteriota bacterium]|nr:MAG: hypothetical protein DMD87_20630 [Candidatus Rokubacteria bacterium]
MREFHCKDVGMPDCSFVAKGKDDDEVMRKATERRDPGVARAEQTVRRSTARLPVRPCHGVRCPGPRDLACTERAGRVVGRRPAESVNQRRAAATTPRSPWSGRAVSSRRLGCGLPSSGSRARMAASRSLSRRASW